ncbi:hypothetical protein BKG69_15940 [Mycobacteroides chelonae]|uniref:hypothetical protein n=1 Tax=Mycobacteroides chelonae TaxID=1774 RepID=UPI0008A95701|nr:hypothetical protein [Mycobacteroides chelonae]OHT78136.1 hypothetical protein BKG69_15940 [Mycobacteroides chelonae]
MGKGARNRKERAEKLEQGSIELAGSKAHPPMPGSQRPETAPSGKKSASGLMGGPASDDPISKLMTLMQNRPKLLICGHFGLEPLMHDERRELFAGVSLHEALETVARVQGKWDVAYTTTQRVNEIECEWLSVGGEGGVCEQVLNRIVIYGDMLISPRATAQLMREIMEHASVDDAAPAIDRNTLTHMLLSITAEQNSSDEFAGDMPTADEMAAFERKLPKMGAADLQEYAKPLIQDEIASSLFNDPLKLEIVLSNTYDLWFTEWAPRSKTTGLGSTPAQAFQIATGIELLDLLRLGRRIIKRSSKTGQVRFTRDELIADGANVAAIDYLFAHMAPSLEDYRTKLQADRDAGAIGHQRYTLTRFPFLAIDDNTFVMIRHQWALDRLCGGQLYFEAGFSLGTSSLRHRFKIAMSDAFEKLVGGILHRIHLKNPHLRVIVDENEMQTAWTRKKGETPSVCDWMLFGQDHCIVIDATNHSVTEDAAQGLATWEAYSEEIEKIFTDGKFEQLLCTIDLVREHHGWGEEKVDNKTMFTPLVIVPDAGVTNGLLSQFDIVRRGCAAFKHLSPQVYAPGIVPLSDVQLLEGMADAGRKFGTNPDMMDLIAKWRTAASKYGMASLQLFLLVYGTPILPLSDHIITNSHKVMRLLDMN